VAHQLKAKAVAAKTGTLIDATVIASASHQDGDAKWSAHRTRKAVHCFKAHVGADADTALVEELSVTPGNVHDDRAGHAALADDPGAVYADTPTEARPSPPRLKPRADFLMSFRPASGEVLGMTLCKSSRAGITVCNAFAAGSRRSSARGSGATACDECDGVDWPKLLFKFI
jgi:transposase, IS5 family